MNTKKKRKKKISLNDIEKPESCNHIRDKFIGHADYLVNGNIVYTRQNDKTHCHFFYL